MSRIWVVVALLFAASACTAAEAPPRAAAGTTSSVPVSGVPVLPAAVERDVGTAYPDPALQAYVDRVGQKLVRGSGLAESYRFVVLDLPVVNAHALPPGYVFVTRGLLAVLDDEAELAAALAHEVGHLTQRHAAQRARARQGVMDAAVEAAAKKHEAIETDIFAYEERVTAVEQVAMELEQENYHDIDRINARKDNVLRLWNYLLELLRARRSRLELSLLLQHNFQVREGSCLS